MFVLFVLARKALWVGHLNFEAEGWRGGGGGGRIGLCKTFFVSLDSVSFYCKGCQMGRPLSCLNNFIIIFF